MLLGAGDAIELHDLPREMKLKQIRESAVEVAERAFLDAVLREAEGRISIAAKAAGIGTRALYDKMRRYDLSKDDYKSR